MIFTKLSGRTLDDISRSFSTLQNGLTKLSFSDNMNAHIVANVQMNSTTEIQVNNPFSSAGVLPDYYVVIRSNGACSLQDGDTAWTNDFIYLKNGIAASPLVSILFLKES